MTSSGHADIDAKLKDGEWMLHFAGAPTHARNHRMMYAAQRVGISLH